MCVEFHYLHADNRVSTRSLHFVQYDLPDGDRPLTRDPHPLAQVVQIVIWTDSGARVEPYLELQELPD